MALSGRSLPHLLILPLSSAVLALPSRKAVCTLATAPSPPPPAPSLILSHYLLRSLRSPSISGPRFSRFLTLSVSRSLPPALSPGIRLALPLVGLPAPSPLHLAHSTSTFRPSSHPVSLSSLLPSPSIVSLIFSIYSSSARFPPEYNHPLCPPLPVLSVFLFKLNSMRNA